MFTLMVFNGTLLVITISILHSLTIYLFIIDHTDSSLYYMIVNEDPTDGSLYQLPDYTRDMYISLPLYITLMVHTDQTDPYTWFIEITSMVQIDHTNGSDRSD